MCVYFTRSSIHSQQHTVKQRQHEEGHHRVVLATGLWFLWSGRGLPATSLQALLLLHTCFSSASLEPSSSPLLLTSAPPLHSLVAWTTCVHSGGFQPKLADTSTVRKWNKIHYIEFTRTFKEISGGKVFAPVVSLIFYLSCGLSSRYWLPVTACLG